MTSVPPELLYDTSKPLAASAWPYSCEINSAPAKFFWPTTILVVPTGAVVAVDDALLLLPHAARNKARAISMAPSARPGKRRRGFRRMGDSFFERGFRWMHPRRAEEVPQ